MDAHRRTISERDAGARHSQVVDNTHAEWVIDQWDRVGRSIMKVATGRDAVLSDSDVEGEIIRLRAALTEARRVLQLRDECVVCKASLITSTSVPHCYDCIVEEEHEDEWSETLAAVAAVLAQEETR
jgi:hypothetical protein